MSTFKQNFLIPTAGHITTTSLASTATSITTGGWTKADSCRSLVAICTVSTFAAGTATFSLKVASDADGAGAAAISGAATLVLSAAGKGSFEVPASMVTSAKPFVCVYCVTAGGTNVVDAVLVKTDPGFSP